MQMLTRSFVSSHPKSPPRLDTQKSFTSPRRSSTPHLSLSPYPTIASSPSPRFLPIPPSPPRVSCKQKAAGHGGKPSISRPLPRSAPPIPLAQSHLLAHEFLNHPFTPFLHPPQPHHQSPQPLSEWLSSHLRYGVVGLRAGYLKQENHPLAFLPIKGKRYARLEGTRLSLAKGPNGEVIWSFDIAGSLVECVPDERRIAIYIHDSQRRRRRVMVLGAHDDLAYQRWSAWLVRASRSVLEMHYSMDRLISKGAFARVVLGRDLHTGEPVAIKLIEKSNAPPSERKYFEREVKIMQRLSHRNIVRCYDVFDNRLRTRIVMEYIEGGTLGDVIAEHRGPLSEGLAKEIMRDILAGVEYLHAMGTIHRDLKPDNCLLSQREVPYGTVKLSDFGLSNVVAKSAPMVVGGMDENGVLTSAVGSPGFVAPEIFDSSYGTAVDIWSCGVILYMMLSGGVMPFPGKSVSEIVASARDGEIEFDTGGLRRASEAAKGLLRGLLRADGKRRLTATQALAHPWFQVCLGKGRGEEEDVP